MTLEIEASRRFQEQIERLLIPMLPGAILEPSPVERDNRIAQFASIMPGGGSMKIRMKVPSDVHYVVKRTQAFTDADIRVANVFLQERSEIERLAIAPHYRDELMDEVPMRVAVRVAAGEADLNEQATGFLRAATALLLSWKSQTYEGHPIASGIAIDENVAGSGPTLSEYARLPASRVLGDGVNSFFAIGASGRMNAFETVGEPTARIDRLERQGAVLILTPAHASSSRAWA